MSNLLKEHKKDIVLVISLFVFIAVSVLLLGNNIKWFDDYVFGIIEKFRCEPLTQVFKFISFLCSTGFIFCTTLCILIFAHNKKEAFYIALDVLLCVLINQILKFLFVRPRPIDINLIVEKGYSFPSGHSMVSMAFYGFIAYIIKHSKMKRKNRRLLIFLLLTLITLIGISRIYLGVHFASDVLGGFTLAIAYLMVYIKFVYRKMKRRYHY